jgi:hypothetical protein
MAIGDESQSLETSLYPSPSSPIQLTSTSTTLSLDEESAPYSPIAPLGGGYGGGGGGGSGKKKLESVRVGPSSSTSAYSSYGSDSSSPERKGGVMRGGFKMPGHQKM